MSDYIFREDAVNLLWLFADESCASVVSDFEALPAADVAPVRHGRWEDVFQDGPCSWSGKCSKCHVRNDIPPLPLAHYCPNCGAKMDKEDSDG